MIETDEERGKTRGDGSYTYKGWCISTDNNRYVVGVVGLG